MNRQKAATCCSRASAPICASPCSGLAGAAVAADADRFHCQLISRHKGKGADCERAPVGGPDGCCCVLVAIGHERVSLTNSRELDLIRPRKPFNAPVWPQGRPASLAPQTRASLAARPSAKGRPASHPSCQTTARPHSQLQPPSFRPKCSLFDS